MIATIYNNVNVLSEEISIFKDINFNTKEVLELAEQFYNSKNPTYDMFLLHTEETRRYYATETLVIITPLFDDRVVVIQKTNEENARNDNTLREWYFNNIYEFEEYAHQRITEILSMCEEVEIADDIY